MPTRRRQNGLDVLDDVLETAVGTLFNRGSEYFEKMRERQVAQVPAAERSQTYVCAACRKGFTIQQMEMINPSTPFGMCRGCFAFVWKAGEEKIKFLANKAAKAARDRVPGAVPGPSVPAQTPPWELLGISQDATLEEINKAWRVLAGKHHPDLVPPGSPAEVREAMRAKFEEYTRARDVMVKLRKPAEAS